MNSRKLTGGIVVTYPMISSLYPLNPKLRMSICRWDIYQDFSEVVDAIDDDPQIYEEFAATFTSQCLTPFIVRV